MVIAAGTVAVAVIFGTAYASVLARVRSIFMDAVVFFVLMMKVLPSPFDDYPDFRRLQPSEPNGMAPP
jgi:multiple sugar transport system permease protein